jgi:hypothetical protein
VATHIKHWCVPGLHVLDDARPPVRVVPATETGVPPSHDHRVRPCRARGQKTSPKSRSHANIHLWTVPPYASMRGFHGKASRQRRAHFVRITRALLRGLDGPLSRQLCWSTNTHWPHCNGISLVKLDVEEVELRLPEEDSQACDVTPPRLEALERDCGVCNHQSDASH